MVVTSCGPGTSSSRGSPDTVTGSSIQVAVLPPQWRSGTAGNEARLALLVAADRYVEPSWAIQAATNNLTAMKEALQSSCGITGTSVSELSGDKVNRDAVKASLTKLGQQIQGRQGLILVYWTGHGCIDQQQEARWFTHYTRELASGGYDNTISRSELASWIAESCPGVTPVVIADVCRTRTNAPPPTATLTPLALWDVQATRAGRFSEAPPPDQASPFTRALVASLSSLAQAGDGGLEQVFTETRRRCLELTGNRQEPELIKPSTQLSDPGLVRSQRLSFAVEGVDAIGGQLISNMTVRLDARAAGKAADGAQRQEAAPGRHVLRLSAPGYCARVEEIELTTERSGNVLRLALLPQLVRLIGRVEPAGVYGVSIRGFDATSREGFHRVRTTSDSNGSFELRLPTVGEGLEVQVTRGEHVVGRGSIPATLDRYRLVSENGIEGIRVLDLGAIRVIGSTSDAVASVAAGLSQVGAIPMPTQLSSLPRTLPSGLDTAMDKNRWDQAMRMVDSKRWSIALDQVQQIAAKMPEELATRWSAYLLAEQARAGELPSAWKILESAATGLPQQAIAAVIAARSWSGNPDPSQYATLVTLEEKLDATAQQAALARRLATAATRIPTDLKRDPTALLDWLHPCTGTPWSNKDWVAAREQGAADALVALTNRAVEIGVTSGTWEMTDQAQAQAQRFPTAAKVSAVAAVLERLKQERQPQAARKAFIAAQEAFANGDAQTAYTQYQAAIEAKANAHYLAQIDPQVEYLRQQLFIRHFNTGLEHEVEGRLAKALESYTAARTFDASVRSDIERLGKGGLDIAGYQKLWEQEDVKFAEEEKPRLAQWQEAKTSNTIAAFAAFIKKYPRAPEIGEANRLKRVAEEKMLAFTSAAGISKPNWATNVGKDQYGFWADLQIAGVTQRFRWIKAGTFTMGSPASEEGRDSDETQHEVTLTKAYWLADSECTQELWQAISGSNPSDFKGAQKPVEKVSWEDCHEFLKKLNVQVAGGNFRLPTEAEWEYACRAGTMDPYARDLASMAWYTDNSGSKTNAVKTKQANAWGLYDMHGNVWEWCGDWKGDYPTKNVTDLTGPQSGSDRVNRGGSWSDDARGCRAAYRTWSTSVNRYGNLGFRFCAQATP